MTRNLRIALVGLALGAALPLHAAAQEPANLPLTQVEDKIVAQEQAEVQLLRKYSPLVETYIQNLRRDKDLGAAPDGDKYFLGRAKLDKGVQIEQLIGSTGVRRKSEGLLGMQFIPSGFLQEIYLDRSGFDRQHYQFEYVRREFLGEVRCLVFDVDPVRKSEKGRFVGRVWVEDQDYHIVRFNGTYSGSSKTKYYFNFDSWRVNAGNNQWLPASIYSEEGDPGKGPLVSFKAFKAQTRLWDYGLGRTQEAQEMSNVLVESAKPLDDQTATANDYSPLQQERSWSREAEDNVIEKMERMGIMAPYGDADKVLETVVNNLEVTNDLDIEPGVRCRLLMTSTLESFTIGHTIVLSRGLVDVLPDEASLAAILAHELGHVVLGHAMDTEFAFNNRLRFNDKDTFRHFGFARSAEEEQAASRKGAELLSKSPYKDQLKTAQLFLAALENSSKEIPNLISPHLGDAIPTSWIIAPAQSSAQPAVATAANAATAATVATATTAKPAANAILALPLGGRIKIDPWSDQLQMIKAKPVGAVFEYEKKPFEVTPIAVYLTRPRGKASTQVAGALKPDTSADEDKGESDTGVKP
jgi:hypothetical protein